MDDVTRTASLLRDQDETDPPEHIWDVEFTRWGDLDPATIEPRRWIYGTHYLQGGLSATIGNGAAGKSILGLTEAIAMVTNRALVGITPSPPRTWEDGDWKGETRGRQVFYYNAEEPLVEIQRRVCAICQYYEIDLKELGAGWACDGRSLTVASGHDFPFVIGASRNGSVEFNKLNLECLEHSDFDVVILDPFVSIHQCPENDNGAIDAIIKRLGKYTANHGAAVDIAHHSRKAAGEITGADARGASAVFDGVRNLRVLNGMTEAEAQRARVDDPRPYFRVEGDKANYCASASGALWLQHKSVLLPNGDNVGIVAGWQPPGVLDGITPAQIKQIQALARGAGYRVDVRSDNWIGSVVAEVLDFDIEDKSEREHIKAILKTWYQSGVLRKVEQLGKDRHPTLVVESGKVVKSAKVS